MDDAPVMKPPIDRQLMARDLEALATLVAPAIEARLTFLQTIPVIGPGLFSRLQGSPRLMTSAALAKILDLSDDDLVVLVDLVGLELGAWRGYHDAAGPDHLEAAGPAYERLAEALSDQ